MAALLAVLKKRTPKREAVCLRRSTEQSFILACYECLVGIGTDAQGSVRQDERLCAIGELRVVIALQQPSEVDELRSAVLTPSTGAGTAKTVTPSDAVPVLPAVSVSLATIS